MPFPNHNTKFKPGQSGNPNGRPKKPSLTAELQALLTDKPAILRALVDRGVKEALKGDFRFWQEVFNRVDGKVATPVEVADNSGVDWTELDNECDTERPAATDTEGPEPVPGQSDA